MAGGQGWLSSLRQDMLGMFAGWINPATGRGDPTRDKRLNARWLPGTPLTWELAYALFGWNALANAVVSALPEWAVRNGWDMTLDAKDAVQARTTVRAIRNKMDDLGHHEVALRCAIWGQLVGGGLMVIGARDGRASNEPLDIEALEDIDWIRDHPRSEVYIRSYYTDPKLKNFGEAELYEIFDRAPGMGTPMVWHESRVIRYPGPLTPQFWRIMNQGWDLSLLDRVIAKILKHDGVWDNAAGMLEDGSQGVWKIKGLYNSSLSGMREEMETRFALAEQARGLFHSLLLDADGEDFQYVHRQFSGVAEVLNASAVDTAAAAQMPVTVLMGQAPAGMNATGESDLRIWNDRVESYQGSVIVPRTEKFQSLLFRCKSGPTNGKEPAGWKTVYRPVRKPTPMESAEIAARYAQIDSAEIAAQMLTPEEAATNRHTAEGWSAATMIDLAARQKVIDSTQGVKLITAPQMTAIAGVLAQVSGKAIAPESAQQLLQLAFPQLDAGAAMRLVQPNQGLAPLALPPIGAPGEPPPQLPPAGGVPGSGQPSK
jgi:phage-related protein (TIGR01555 family)